MKYKKVFSGVCEKISYSEETKKVKIKKYEVMEDMDRHAN